MHVAKPDFYRGFWVLTPGLFVWQALYLLSHPPTLIPATCSARSWKENNQDQTATVSDAEMTRDLAGLETASCSFLSCSFL